MTTADHPSVTDDARAEAQRRYQGDWDPYHGEPVDDFGFSDAERRAFTAGAEWAAGRAETTTATTEDAERLLAEQYGEWLHRMHGISASTCNHYPEARGTAQVLAAAGLLARPTPSRDDLMRAAGLYGKQADAVLALLKGGTDE